MTPDDDDAVFLSLSNPNVGLPSLLRRFALLSFRYPLRLILSALVRVSVSLSARPPLLMHVFV